MRILERIGNAVKAFRGETAQKSLQIEVDGRGNPTWWPLNFEAYRYNDRNFQDFVHCGYGRNPYVFMATDKVAGVVSTLPYFLQDAKGNPVTTEKEIERLLSAPNADESWGEFMYRVVSSYMATGNAIIYETTAIGFNRPSELRCAIVQDVVIYTNNGTEQGRAVSYSINYVGTIPAERVLHIKRPNIIHNTVWGLSPLNAGQTLYEGSNNTFTAAASIHKNRGASGIVSSSSANIPMTPKERDAVQSEFQRKTAGPNNMGFVYVASVPMQYTGIGMNATDLRLIEFNVEYLRTICSLFGIDSSLFNDPANKTYNNRSEAQKAFYADVVLPMAVMLYGQLGKWLLQGKFKKMLTFAIDKSKLPALQEDLTALHQRVNADIASGILTAEEARLMLYPDLANLKPIQI
jgi:HK97 family phage portal protein